MDPNELEVGGPDPAQLDAGLEGTDSSDAGSSTCVEHADDGLATRDTDPAQIDPVDHDPAARLGTGQADGPGSDWPRAPLRPPAATPRPSTPLSMPQPPIPPLPGPLSEGLQSPLASWPPHPSPPLPFLP